MDETSTIPLEPLPEEPTAPAATSIAKSPFRWGSFLTYFVTFTLIAGVLGLGVMYYLGRDKLQSRAAALASSRDIAVRFKWPLIPMVTDADKAAGPRTWLPRQFQEELTGEATRRMKTSADPLGGRALADLGAWLAGSGWFDGTPTIRRAADGAIDIEGKWRVPAAVVRSDSKDYVVSWEGKLMPPVYNAGEAGLRTIVGVSQSPPLDKDGARDFTHAWPGDDVAAGLELMGLIVKQKWAAQVAGVDVSDFTAKSKLTINTTLNNTRVVWGGKPSKPLIGEAATSLKLANISTLFRDTGRIDGGYPLVYMEVPAPTFDRSATSAAAKRTSAYSIVPPQ